MFSFGGANGASNHHNTSHASFPVSEDLSYDHQPQEMMQQNNQMQPDEIPRDDFRQSVELPYQPTIVRWVKSNYLQQIKGEQHTVLVGGYDHCDRYHLQTLMYGKSPEDQSIIEVRADGKMDTLPAEIGDIAFASDDIAVVVMRNGQIETVKLQQNDDYSTHSVHLQDDEKMASMDMNDDGLKQKWTLKTLTNPKCPIICYPDGNTRKFPAALTSVAVNEICGKIVVSDECGYIYITDIEKQRTPNSQV